MGDVPFLVIFVIGVALVFDFINGFHDAANSIATIVVTKVMTPHQAVLMAAIANFVGAFIFPLAVAAAIGKGMVDPHAVDLYIILAALIGAILWDLLTWILGLPTSSSHALIGGLIGSVMVTSGFDHIYGLKLLKVVGFIFMAPILGFIGASIFTLIVLNLFKDFRPKTVKEIFNKVQLVSSFLYSVSHGTNDAQKTMGIIALVLASSGLLPIYHGEFDLPLWVILSCHAAIALGTYLGGWRIVKTMGTKITKIRSLEGCCAEGSSSLVLFLTAHIGMPVSTTHVISGSIMGVGFIENFKTVKWITARKMLFAWVLTIPASAAISGLACIMILGLRQIFNF